MADIAEIVESLESGQRAPSGRTLAEIGRDMHGLAERLYPICRSITGDGLRESLAILGEQVPLEISEVPTGTTIFDWTVPLEWNIRDAYIADSSGTKLVDFKQHNLHVVNYSAPIDRTMSLEELRPKLHALSDKPDWIPYRTAYYNEDWGFCLKQNQLDSLEEQIYRVVIDSTLEPGALTYGELAIPGELEEEILLFAHCCHPSLANDNLAGVAVLTMLGEIISEVKTRHSIRIVFAPATIGSICWMARNEHRFASITAGLVASVLGDTGHFRYKQSRQGNALVDRACQLVLSASGQRFDILEFSPWGYDERQFCSPGIDLPVGRLTRTPNGEYPEYHTSADDLSFITAENLAGSLVVYLKVIDCIDADQTYLNTAPKGEPQLGKRGLYRKMGGFQDIEDAKLAMLWMLNQSDGKHSLLDIAEKSGMAYGLLRDAAKTLIDSGLLVGQSKRN